MRARPLAVLSAVAAMMVAWFSVRMWAGDAVDVWRVSCLLGSWAPWVAARLFLYVDDVGDREDTVFAAWLVRAIGMHAVLAWLVGFSDWLRGPPNTPPAWNSDLGAPVVLLSFFPLFGVCLASLRWLRGLGARLEVPRVERHVVASATAVPYRGGPHVPHVVAHAPWRARVASALVSALVVAVAASLPASPWVLALSAALLGLSTSLGAPALPPSVAALVAVAGLTVARDLPAVSSSRHALDHAFAWPLTTVAAGALYLAVAETRLRLAGAPRHTAHAHHAAQSR